MSLYEALALAALAGVGCFAYFLYRRDTRPKTPGGPKTEVPTGHLMFGRAPRKGAADRSGSGAKD